MKRRAVLLVPLAVGASSLGWTQQAGKVYRIGWLSVSALEPRPTFRAARSSTTTTPIVMAFWGGSDLVQSGIVASLARPGGNITGVHMLLQTLDAKRLDLLHQAVPRARKIAVLIHDQQAFEPQMPSVREVALQLGLELLVVNTRDSERGYEGAFEVIARAGAEALLVMGSPVFSRDQKLIADLAGRWRIPAVVGSRSSAHPGLLISYGTIEQDLDRQAARFVDRILRGAAPGDLPIEQPTRFRLVIDLKAAKTLGITIPQSLLLRADEVIQ